MWKKLRELPYYILYSSSTQNTKYSVLVTNYVKIWQMTYSKSDLLELLKKSNAVLQIDETELLEKANNILKKPNELKNASANEINNDLEVILKKSFGFPFTVKLHLFKGSDELFFDAVTLPLLKTVHDLKSSEQELQQLLKKKDKEIEEYKQEGGEIALRHLKTVPFDEKLHTSRHNTHENYFETLDFRLSENESMGHMKFFGSKSNEEYSTESSSSSHTDIKKENLSQPKDVLYGGTDHSPKSESRSSLSSNTLPRPDSQSNLEVARKRKKVLNF